MTKRKFLMELRTRLVGLPQEDIEESVSFYAEMIDDLSEDGISEEDIFEAIGPIEEVAEQIISEVPLAKIAKEKIKPKRRLRAWEIVLLVLGSPIWLSLGIAAVAVILSLYVVLWSLIASLWAIFTSFCAISAFGIAVGVTDIVLARIFNGLSLVGLGIFSAGVSIFLFFGSLYATKGIILLTKKIALCIKKCFVGKGNRK